jgi:hypothetical protein
VVVKRVLECGGKMKEIANCEHFSLSPSLLRLLLNLYTAPGFMVTRQADHQAAAVKSLPPLKFEPRERGLV